MITLCVPFRNVLQLTLDPSPRVHLLSEVEEWLAVMGHSPVWRMNNPWEAFFEYECEREAMLFKLRWGGK